jgi:hypothetical protein
MMRATLTIALLASLGLSACSGMPQERYAGPVMVVPDADDVAKCKFVDSLGSSSGLTGFFAPKGVDNIKQNLLRQADALGATHVVWDKPTAGLEATTLTGKAYKCPPAPAP